MIMEIGPNTLFVPIIGERVDAHIFIPNALKEGGACLTQEHTEASGNAPYIKVPDTLTAMQQIAAYYRNKMSLFTHSHLKNTDLIFGCQMI